MKKTNIKFIVLMGVIFVSFSAILTKSSDAPAIIIAFYRLTFTVVLLLPFFLKNHAKEFKTIDRRTLVICLISGVFLALHFATWFASLKLTTVASSTVLVNTHPIFIVAGTIFILKEKVSKKAIVSIAIALAGSFIISTGDYSLGKDALWGDVLAILGALFVAGYMMIGRIARQKISVTTYTFIVYSSSALTLLILSILTRTPLYPYPAHEYLKFLGLALLCTLLGHSIFNWALEYVKPAFISTAVLGEPVFATIWAMIVFSEFPTIWQVVGSIIILYGIYRFTRIKEDTVEANVEEATAL